MNWLALLIVPAAIVAIAYGCLVVKLGFLVADRTEHTGFGVGFYMMTVVGGVALPVAVVVGVFT